MLPAVGMYSSVSVGAHILPKVNYLSSKRSFTMSFIIFYLLILCKKIKFLPFIPFKVKIEKFITSMCLSIPYITCIPQHNVKRFYL